MRRIPISVRSEPFDVEKAQPAIDVARHAFADYLDQVPRKSIKSKYGLMGPVGKILSEIKSGRRDASSLKGYAVRVHEASDRGRSPSAIAMQKLENGIDTLTNLLNDAPVTFHDRIIDRLDYGLYYELRKRQAASKEALRQAWIEHIRRKYGTIDALALAWNEAIASFEGLYLPRKNEGSRAKRATTKQADIANFWESQGSSISADEEEE